jgi:hypothetical protein
MAYVSVQRVVPNPEIFKHILLNSLSFCKSAIFLYKNQVLIKIILFDAEDSLTSPSLKA